MMFLVGAANGYSMQMGGAVRVSRAAMSKLAAPRMDITVEKSGEFGTTDFTMTFKCAGCASLSLSPDERALDALPLFSCFFCF